MPGFPAQLFVTEYFVFCRPHSLQAALTEFMREGNSESSHGFFMSDVLRSVTGAVSRRPRTTLLCVFSLACLCVGYTIGFLEFRTERSDLIDPTSDYHQRWISYTESFGDESDIVVVVEGKSPGAIKKVLDEVGSRMEQRPDLFTNILFKVQPGRLQEKGLQYLSATQLEAGLQRLAEYRPLLQGRWNLIQLDSLFARLADSFDNQATLDNPSTKLALLQQSAFLTESLQRFAVDRNDFQSPWPELLPVDQRMRDEAREVIYFLNDRGTMGFLKAFPVREVGEINGPSRSIDELRLMVEEVKQRHSAIEIGLTGIPVLENDEIRESQSDMTRASVFSFAGVGILLFIGFRGFRHPLLAMIMLAFGMAWAFGFTTLVVGHLNILSISFAVILIGLGIDFGIHYLARYLELRHEGHMLRSALLETSRTVGTGILTAAVTTSLGFFCAAFTRFLGVAELGIVAGGGILLCTIATFVVLPALIALADRNVEPRKLPIPFEGQTLRLLISRYPLAVTMVCFGVIGYFGSRSFAIQDGRFEWKVAYDYNLLNLQADNLESVLIQKRIAQGADGSLLYAVSLADTAEEARLLHAKFEELPSVRRVEELASRLPPYPAEQTRLLVQAFHAELAKLADVQPQLGVVSPLSVGMSMEEFYVRVRKIDHPLASDSAVAVDLFLDEFEELTEEEQFAFLGEYQMRMVAALLGQFHALLAASDDEPVTLADFPEELTSRFVSPNGKWLLQVYPRHQIWDLEPLSTFVQEVRSVDPEITGTPLQNFEASQQIMDSYQNAAVYALIVICLVLMIDFLGRDHTLIATLLPLAVIVGVAATLHWRGAKVAPEVLVGSYIAMSIAVAAILDLRSFRDTILAMLPPLGGGILMFGILGLLKVSLNPANLIVLPLILGIGVDDGVHVIHDFRNQRRRYRTSSSTINAIVLTSLTSMIGFGSLMISAHRGLHSLGLVLVVGVGSCLFVSLVPLPAILTLFFGNRVDSGWNETDDASGQSESEKESEPVKVA